jgi:hypothetical protein
MEITAGETTGLRREQNLSNYNSDENLNTRIMRRIDERGGELADAKGFNCYDLELDGGADPN